MFMVKIAPIVLSAFVSIRPTPPLPLVSNGQLLVDHLPPPRPFVSNSQHLLLLWERGHPTYDHNPALTGKCAEVDRTLRIDR